MKKYLVIFSEFFGFQGNDKYAHLKMSNIYVRRHSKSYKLDFSNIKISIKNVTDETKNLILFF